jgi:hypothetical protein
MAEDILIGQAALVDRMGLRCPPPSVTSLSGPGARRTIIENGRHFEKYGPAYAPEDTLAGHLKFALKYEPVDMGVIAQTMKSAHPAELGAWVGREPNGAYARRAWFLYEWITGKRLDLPDAGAVAYTPALDPARNITATATMSRRHKVQDNLLGVPGYCPSVRRTAVLDDFKAQALDQEARAILAGCDPQVLARAANYLYTKETRTSFEIEREVATGKRAERFVAALRSTASFDPTDVAGLTALQNMIVDPRYAATGLRDFQNFVGETVGGYREVVHFICPKPDDLPTLTAAWGRMAQRLKGTSDPVVAAALVAFGFVFLHPFEDGNGRIHRYLIHQVLSQERFTPTDMLFPVSAAILRDLKGYDAALESFSKPINAFIDWSWTPGKQIAVANDTADLYRYFDATALAEFLYGRIADTIRIDLKEELTYVAVYDEAFRAVRDIIDMPDRRASLLVRLCLQNSGKLSNRKRNDFPELTEAELTAIGEAITEIVESNGQQD